MFMGLGKGTLAMFLLFFRDVFVLIPLLIIFSSCLGLFGAWLALPLANIIAFFVILFWAKKEFRRFDDKKMPLKPGHFHFELTLIN